MTTVNMLQAKTSLSKLVQALESGAEAEIIIARNGKPAARLVPIGPHKLSGQRIGLYDGKYPKFTAEQFKASDIEIERMFAETGLVVGDHDETAA